MKFKNIKISKESVLQSLIEAGLEFEETNDNSGIVLELPDGTITPISASLSFFETDIVFDEQNILISYASGFVENRFNNDEFLYSYTINNNYQNTTIIDEQQENFKRRVALAA